MKGTRVIGFMDRVWVWGNEEGLEMGGGDVSTRM